jgi:hypothetical protein
MSAGPVFAQNAAPVPGAGAPGLVYPATAVVYFEPLPDVTSGGAVVTL